MGVIYPRGTGYTSSTSAGSGVQGWTSDAYVCGGSRRIGEIYYGGSSKYPADTNGVNTGGNQSIASALGITTPANAQIGAITFTCADLQLVYRDSIKSAWWNSFEIAIANSYASVATNWNQAGVVASISNVAIHPESNNQSDTWGNSHANIMPLLQNCSLPFLNKTSFYILIRNPSISTSHTLRFERISSNRDQGRNHIITVTGTLKKPIASITTPAANGKYWGTELQTAGSINNNFVGAGTFAYKLDTGSYSTNTSTWPKLTSLATAASTGTAHTFYVKAAYATGYAVSGVTQTYGDEVSRSFTMYGTKPTISIGTITAGTNSASVPFTVNYAAKTTGTYQYSLNNSTWTNCTSPASITGLSLNTGYTVYIRAQIATGYPEAGTYVTASKTFTTLNYTACGAPTVTIAYAGDGKLRVSWSGATAGTNNAITGYDVGIVTSKTAPGSPTNDTASPCDFTPGNTTAYYGAVRTKGAAGSSYYSGWAYSASTASCPMASHPTVSVGDIITKTKMDTLKTWKAKGTEVTVGNTITKTIGDTYATTPAVGNTVEATWYNNA